MPAQANAGIAVGAVRGLLIENRCFVAASRTRQRVRALHAQPLGTLIARISEQREGTRRELCRAGERERLDGVRDRELIRYSVRSHPGTSSITIDQRPSCSISS